MEGFVSDLSEKIIAKPGCAGCRFPSCISVECGTEEIIGMIPSSEGRSSAMT
jgi:hypothetical protein